MKSSSKPTPLCVVRSSRAKSISQLAGFAIAWSACGPSEMSSFRWVLDGMADVTTRGTIFHCFRLGALFQRNNLAIATAVVGHVRTDSRWCGGA